MKQTLIYKTVEGLDIHADVYRPPDDEICPAILWLHGGALILGSRDAIRPDQLERYLQAGFAVISADYRLAPEVKIDAIIEDLRDAHAWMRQEGTGLLRIDPDRIAVVGHSAGGYLALMAGFCVRPRPQALVSFYGYGDISGPWYSRPSPHYCQEPRVSKDEAYLGVGGRATTGIPFDGPQMAARRRFYLYCRQQGAWPLEVTGHDPDCEPEWFDPFCPVRNVTAEYPPTLLIHGDQDTDVPFEQSVLMAEEMKRNGVEHEFIALPGIGHGFDGAGIGNPTVAGVVSRALSFLGDHIE